MPVSAAAAFVFERTAAGARGVTTGVLSPPGPVSRPVSSPVWRPGRGGGVGGRGRCVTDRRALRFDELDDFHGGFESYGCRCLLVTQNVSKSVECEVGEAAEFV